ncbi:hypothetical protein D3C78_1537230 [compost metagenome]
MPALARAGFDDPGRGRFAHHAHALDLHLEHHRLDIAGQHDIAAASQHQHGPAAPQRVGEQRAHIIFGMHAHQGMGAGRDAKGVAVLQGYIFLD